MTKTGVAKKKASVRKIEMVENTGPFAEDKDIARDIRTKQIVPALKRGELVVLDFGEVHLSTQPFIHALLSELIRGKHGGALDKMKFKNCNPLVRSLIRTVAEYSQETDAHRE